MNHLARCKILLTTKNTWRTPTILQICLYMHKNKYKIACFVARNHGLAALQTLLEDDEFIVDCIFTHRLNPKSVDPNRGEREEFREFQAIANQQSIKLVTVDSKSERSKMDKYLEETKNLDLIASISWKYLIPENVIKHPTIGGVNLHRGKLPDYKGLYPIYQALERDEAEIQITSHEMTEVIDDGEILSIVSHPANYDKYKSLDENVNRLKEEITCLFGPLLLSSLHKLIEKKT